MKMQIRASDLVLEVGSGDKPYPRADVLLDKLPEDSSEREAGRGLVIDRPLVIADIEVLPFTDKTFDYIIASHVLEHAHNPAKFLDEISRVGKRGYIGTPTSLSERVYDWSFHRWYVNLEGTTLILIRKTEKSKKFLGGKRADFYYLGGTKLLNWHYQWEGKIRYKIFNKEPDGFLESLDQKLIKFKKESTIKELRKRSTQGLKSGLLSVAGLAPLTKWLKDSAFKVKFGFERRLEARKRRKDIDIFSLIVCPACKRRLVLRKKKLGCHACGRQFSFYRKKIPILLV